ncbi:hypothetical protein CA267_013150 [Alteromonas pelagimontana]|uniref:Uncharacterized protein n=1 Tax=Alteromonas pelagimontana TaxID=1858656 RepID=A0A6M4MEP2_9ALTE|nr:hypothetical protein [Alteromonas pelagimontana]QJR81644.1 hypothetical protein CA267_013150 [Alteromonas pelagimontana]
MARIKNTRWQRCKYLLSALVLMLPPWFYYQSQNPEFPDALPGKTVGNFDIVPMPFDINPPYQHDGMYVKDFLLMFNKGEVKAIKQAYLNIGDQPLPLAELQTGDLGILHGTRHGQHVHALSAPRIEASHKVWLTIEQWGGEVLTASWDVPVHLITRQS